MFKKKKYMSWEKYSKRIDAQDHIRFIDKTFKDTLKNQATLKEEE